MPLQNRITPFSAMEANPARGAFMGNRGILHDHNRTLVTQRWRHKAWIICTLTHKDWHRQVMRPRRYTELFFLDEATALAAGHRPCALCRNKAYKAYMAALAGRFGKAAALDLQLHGERTPAMDGRAPLSQASLAVIPEGAMFVREEAPCQPWLKWAGAYRSWHHHGYGPPTHFRDRVVRVLTPATSRIALGNGYCVQVNL